MTEPRHIYRMEVGTAEFGVACFDAAQRVGGVMVGIRKFSGTSPHDEAIRDAAIKYQGHLRSSGRLSDPGVEGSDEQLLRREGGLVRDEAARILAAGGVLVTLATAYDSAAAARLQQVADEAWRAHPPADIPTTPPQ